MKSKISTALTVQVNKIIGMDTLISPKSVLFRQILAVSVNKSQNIFPLLLTKNEVGQSNSVSLGKKGGKKNYPIPEENSIIDVK